MPFRFLLFGILLSQLGLVATAQSARDITLNVHHHGAAKGFIMVALYKSEDGFPNDPQKAILQIKEATQSKITTIRMQSIPFGNYAIAVFHDANSDGKINYNLLGAPTEAYGFSNNARKMFSAPSFKEAMFRHAGETNLKIDIK